MEQELFGIQRENIILHNLSGDQRVTCSIYMAVQGGSDFPYGVASFVKRFQEAKQDFFSSVFIHFIQYYFENDHLFGQFY